MIEKMKYKKYMFFVILIICIFSVFMKLFFGGIYRASAENSIVKLFLSHEINIDEYIESYEMKDLRYDQPNGVDIFLKNITDTEFNHYTVTLNCLSDRHSFKFSIDKNTDAVSVYNLIPDQWYLYKIYAFNETQSKFDSFGFVKSEGANRMIKADSLYNIRDLGGWETEDGKSVVYGKIYRGSGMNSAQNMNISETDKDILKNQLGITADLDLREEEESLYLTESPMGNEIDYIRIPITAYGEFITEPGDNLKAIMNTLIDNEVIYIHCYAGCDRTGTVSWLILGLLGVPEEDLIKDYELSSFSIFGNRTKDERYDSMAAAIKGYPGECLQEKIQNYFLDHGVSKDEIDILRKKMTE